MLTRWRISSERFTGVFAGELLIAQRRHFDLNVDAVEQRAGYFGAVALDLQRRADAFLLRVGEKAAGAGIHRGDQHEARRIIDRAHGARDGDAAVFERLAHDLEDVAAELRQLVEKQHAVVGQRDFAGFGHRAAADQAGIGDRVMRRAERPRGDDRLRR